MLKHNTFFSLPIQTRTHSTNIATHTHRQPQMHPHPHSQSSIIILFKIIKFPAKRQKLEKKQGSMMEIPILGFASYFSAYLRGVFFDLLGKIKKSENFTDTQTHTHTRAHWWSGVSCRRQRRGPSSAVHAARRLASSWQGPASSELMQIRLGGLWRSPYHPIMLESGTFWGHSEKSNEGLSNKTCIIMMWLNRKGSSRGKINKK